MDADILMQFHIDTITGTWKGHRQTHRLSICKDRQTYTATHRKARTYKDMTDFELCLFTDNQVI